MFRPKRDLTLIGFLLVGAVMLVTATVVFTSLTIAMRPKPKVPLTAKLSGTWAQVSEEFDQRVQTQFPVGSKESDLITMLRQQDFARNDWTWKVDAEREAIRREDSFPCRQAAYVRWHADENNILTSIKGLYREEGCL